MLKAIRKLTLARGIQNRLSYLLLRNTFMKPLISLIVPVYNVERFIERCLISLINQTYSNLEIIVVNDGSTDGSRVIAQAVSVKDKRVILIDQCNMGLGEARNTGIKNSAGEFAVFIDSDDWIEERMIELLVSSAILSNADIVCCGFNEIIENERNSYFLNMELNSENDYIALCLNEVHKNKHWVITTVWAKLFKLSLLRDYSILFNLSTFEDSPFFFKAVYHSNKISFVREPLYNYFVRTGSITNSPISESKLSCF
ncbi:MAG: hypothetical protein C0490_27995, partial [Marivirga sp.]|nr:hypothetical protein [Marivirga sp.]